MHPADQVEAFAKLSGDGATVAEIAARFGVSERTVERRLRLGNAAPELLEAYRAGHMGLECLQAFCATPDTELQLAVWEELKAQHYGPSVWQIRRLLNEGRIPATSAIAKFIGAAAYEKAGGPLTRDLFAEEDEAGTWFDDPALLRKLALDRLETAAEELRTKWAWAEARVELEWSDTARFARIRPKPGEPTEAEAKETEELTARRDELGELHDGDWTEELESEYERIEARLEEIERAVSARAVFRRKDRQMAGAIVTVGDDGTMHVIQGLVRPEDVPGPADGESTASNGSGADAGDANGSGHFGDRVSPPALSRPEPSPDPAAVARKRTGIGIGLGDDMRAIRTSLVKAHLAEDFDAAFDLCVFQMARAVFRTGYQPHALDIRLEETADRPPLRRDDAGFAKAALGEGMLDANLHALPLVWLDREDDAEAFQALRDLSAEAKQALFAACVARTVKGQLAFEPTARPELEATVARLDIDFAKLYRPDAELFWSRMTKPKLLEIAAGTIGPDWAAARAKSKKAQVVASMARAFAADPDEGSALPARERAAALAWTPPGFRPFDTGEAPSEADTAEASDTGEQADAAKAQEPAESQETGNGAAATAANGGDGTTVETQPAATRERRGPRSARRGGARVPARLPVVLRTARSCGPQIADPCEPQDCRRPLLAASHFIRSIRRGSTDDCTGGSRRNARPRTHSSPRSGPHVAVLRRDGVLGVRRTHSERAARRGESRGHRRRFGR